MNAGKPVLCETPFVFSKKQAEELYSIAEKKGLLLQICLLYTSKECGQAPVVVSAKEGTGIQGIFDAILEKLPENFGEQTITGDLVREGDVVLLVLPQDIQAPKGRLILPQVQTIRELLDKKCLVMSCTTCLLYTSICCASF